MVESCSAGPELEGSPAPLAQVSLLTSSADVVLLVMSQTKQKQHQATVSPFTS